MFSFRGYKQFSKEEKKQLSVFDFVEEDEDAPKGKRPKGSPKKKRDPNAPKKPLSAYMFFTKSKRDETKVTDMVSDRQAEFPGASMVEVTKLLGQKWKELDEVDKSEYNEQAVADKRRYEKEKAKYLASKEGKDKSPKKKKPSKEKTPYDF